MLKQYLPIIIKLYILYVKLNFGELFLSIDYNVSSY